MSKINQNENVNTSIPDAINKRLVLEVFYEPGMRIIEPHAIGIGSEGQILVRAFQSSGASASGEHLNWKLFRIEKIHNARLTGTTFEGPRPGYLRGDSAMTRGIIAQL